jgi:hypothetical protein
MSAPPRDTTRALSSFNLTFMTTDDPSSIRSSHDPALWGRDTNVTTPQDQLITYYTLLRLNKFEAYMITIA